MKFFIIPMLLFCWLFVDGCGLVGGGIIAQEPAKDNAIAAALAEALKDRRADWEVRVAAAEALRRLPTEQAADALGVLTEALADPIYAVRRSAALTLAKLGPRAEPAVPELVKLLADRDDSVKSAAVAALAAVGPKAKAAVPALLAIAKNQSAPQRTDALTALGTVGQADPAVLEVLLAGLDDAPNVVKTASATLGKFGASAVEPLVKLLKTSPKQTVREQAAATLAQVGEPAVSTLLAEFAAAGSSGQTQALRHLLAQTLAKIGKPALAGLSAAAKDTAHPGRLLAVEALGWLGTDAADALVALSSEPELPPAVLERAIGALAVAGVGHEAAQQRLLELVESTDVGLRRAAVAALGSAKATQAMARLAELANTDTQPLPVRLAAVRSLGQLGESAKAAVPTLLEIARSKADQALRQAAVVVLATIGRGEEVEATLLELTRDPDNGVRRVAIEGLARPR